MTLFDDISRINTDSKKRNETLFGYYNTSARLAVASLRAILQSWFENYPQDAQAELRSRIRSDNTNFHAAFWELYLHEILLRLGFNIELHPQLPGSKTVHPDFLVKKGDVSLFYLEATLSQPSQEEMAAQSRMNQLYDTLDRMDSPNFFIEVRQVRGAPNTPPPGKKLRSDLTSWLSNLNPDNVANLYKNEGFESLPIYEWVYENWQVDFKAIPKSPHLRGQQDVRTIGAQSDPMSVVNSHTPILSSLLGKTKYGHLDLPLIVAINALLEYVDEFDIANALFGEENITRIKRRDGSVEHRQGRNPNGLWFGPNGPKNTRISGVLSVESFTVWEIGRSTPMLFHNPWATNSLNQADWPLPQIAPNANKTELIFVPGKSANEVLEVPDSWPIE